MNLFLAVILTVLICCLLLLGGSYALPVQTDEVYSNNTAVIIWDTSANTSSYFDKDSLSIDNQNSEY